MQQGREKDAKGLKEGIYDLIFASTFQEGNGADFSNSNKISNKELGLEAEDVETETKKVWEAVH